MEGVLLFYKYVQYYPKFPNEYENKVRNTFETVTPSYLVNKDNNGN